jgi:hypothetical protein
MRISHIARGFTVMCDNKLVGKGGMERAVHPVGGEKEVGYMQPTAKVKIIKEKEAEVPTK